MLLNDGDWTASPSHRWLRIADATVAEGDAGTTNANFPVTLSTASDQDVTVRYATADGTAAAGSDYEVGFGQVTILAGQTSVVIAVPVYGDRVAEAGLGGSKGTAIGTPAVKELYARNDPRCANRGVACR